MGTFLGHFVPGFALAILGLWHVINTIRSYFLKRSSDYRSTFWFPFTASFFKFKHLELVLILSFSVFAIVLQVLDYPDFHFAFKLDNFEHATMFLHLAIFAGFSLFAEVTRVSEAVYGITGVLAASVFGQELFLLHFHSTDHVGLEGHYHWLLQLIVFISFLAVLGMACVPTSFIAAVVLAISVAFQGCWFVNMGFVLWIPRFIPEGCVAQLAEKNSSAIHGAVTCASHEADLRARALADLQFSWILAALLAFTACFCVKFAAKNTSVRQTTEYAQLQVRGVEIPLSFDGFKHDQS